MEGKENLAGRLIEAGALLAARKRRTSAETERLLELLRANPRISVRDLAEKLGVGLERLDRMLGRMEALGLATVGPGEDGGPMEASLTACGKRRAELAEKEREKTESLLGCLSEEERRQLAGLLDRLLERLRDEAGEEDWERPRREAFRGFAGGAWRRPGPFEEGRGGRCAGFFFGWPAF